MATYIEMPKLSDTMTEGVLVRWLKAEGDRVEIYRPLIANPREMRKKRARDENS